MVLVVVEGVTVAVSVLVRVEVVAAEEMEPKWQKRAPHFSNPLRFAASVRCTWESVGPFYYRALIKSSVAQNGYISKETAQGLFENILSRPVKIKSLLIGRNIRPANWNTFIDTQDFRNVCGKMEDFSFTARFTEDQVEAVRSVSGVKSTILFDPNGDESKQITISKGFWRHGK